MAAPAELFEAMAERIRAMKPEEFAGAILIVPPASQVGAGEPIEVLTVEGSPNEDHFWGSTKMRVDARVAAFQEELRRRTSGMGFR